MCLQDIRLGRFVNYQKVNAVSTIDGGVLLQRNPVRVGFTIVPSVPGTDAFSIAYNTIDGSTIFAAVSAFQSTILATIQMYGSIIQEQIICKTPTDALIVSIVEFTLPESYLAYSMDEWDTGYTKWLSQHLH